jgi:hypothetical protein
MRSDGDRRVMTKSAAAIQRTFRGTARKAGKRSQA